MTNSVEISDYREDMLAYFSETKEWSYEESSPVAGRISDWINKKGVFEEDFYKTELEARMESIKGDLERNVGISIINEDQDSVSEVRSPLELERQLQNAECNGKKILKVMSLVNQYIVGSFAARTIEKVKGSFHDWVQEIRFPEGFKISIRATKDKNVILEVSDIVTNIYKFNKETFAKDSDEPELVFKGRIFYDLLSDKFTSSNSVMRVSLPTLQNNKGSWLMRTLRRMIA